MPYESHAYIFVLLTLKSLLIFYSTTTNKYIFQERKYFVCKLTCPLENNCQIQKQTETKGFKNNTILSQELDQLIRLHAHTPCEVHSCSLSIFTLLCIYNKTRQRETFLHSPATIYTGTLLHDSKPGLNFDTQTRAEIQLILHRLNVNRTSCHFSST